MGTSAASYLQDMAKLPLSNVLSRIAKELVKECSLQFSLHVSSGELLKLPEAMLFDILASEYLVVASEDAIVDFLMTYLQRDQG